MWSGSKSNCRPEGGKRRNNLIVFVVICSSIIFVFAAHLAEVSASNRGHSDECSCDDESFNEMQWEFQTVLTWPKKRPKIYEPSFRPSKRRGRRTIVTTLFNIHSKEAVPVFLHRMPPERVLDNLFRCRGFGDERRVDPKLVEAAIEAAKKFKSRRINIISAYRSPKFNDSLAKKGRRVAAESKHTQGLAMDISLHKTPASKLGAWLIENFEGGVGIYKNDNFVHIDMGRKRRWYGK